MNLSSRKKMTINLEIDAGDFGTIHLEASEVIRVPRRGRGQEPQISAQQSRELKNLQTEKNDQPRNFECVLRLRCTKLGSNMHAY